MADSPLQKSPDGVLGALDLKVLGQNPTLFSEALAPIVDVYDQYLATQLAAVVSANGSFITPAVGASAFIDVPTGRSYRVLAVAGISILNAADVALTAEYQFSVRAPFQTAGTGSVQFAQSPVISPLSAGVANRNWGFYLPRPLYLSAGCRLAMSMGLSAGPTVTTTFTLRAFCQVIVT